MICKNNQIKLDFHFYTGHNAEAESDMLMEPDEYHGSLLPQHSSYFQSTGKRSIAFFSHQFQAYSY